MNMKRITYDEWKARFEVKDESAADEDFEISDCPERFGFYDNGAVSNEEGTFVIKADQVSSKH